MAKRKRKTARFGLVRHSRKKMAARYWDKYHKGEGGQVKRDIDVHVMIERGSVPTNTSRRHGFFATACFGGRKARMKYKKCGPMSFGPSPTAAAKRALVSLGRDKRVK